MSDRTRDLGPYRYSICPHYKVRAVHAGARPRKALLLKVVAQGDKERVWGWCVVCEGMQDVGGLYNYNQGVCEVPHCITLRSTFSQLH
jgi:hypothetical protein